MLLRGARALCTLLCCAVACGAAACGGGASNSHVAALASALPAALEPTPVATGEPRVVKVRVWADEAARAQPRWRDQLLEQIDAASQFWSPLLGVRIEVEGVRSWQRKQQGSAALAELAALDPGQDVAWVVGYLGPDGTASIAMSERGFAEVLGRHVLVLDWSPVPETAKLREELEPLTEAERGEVVAAHRRHKQTVVLLHYLHLTLGAVLEQEEAWIGSRGYAPSLRTVSERTRQVLAVALESKLQDEERGAAAARLIDELERAEGPSWVAVERDTVLAQLRAIVERERAGKVVEDVPRAARELLDRARALAKGGDVAGARRELEGLLVAYPANAALHLMRCELSLVTPGLSDPATASACQRAMELAPADPRPELALARAQLAAKDRAAARATLASALPKARALPAPAEAVIAIAELYRGFGALTWAEEALAALPAEAAASPVAAWAAGTRVRYGVPRGSAFVEPQDEGELVGAIRAALDAVYADKFADADKLLAAAQRRWPKAPGIPAVRCDLALRRDQLALARRHCAQALRAEEGQSWAHYLAGIVALRGPDTKGGIAHLRRAIELDPELAQAWRALGKALERAKDQAELQKVRAEYQTRFGQVLP